MPSSSSGRARGEREKKRIFFFALAPDDKSHWESSKKKKKPPTRNTISPLTVVAYTRDTHLITDSNRPKGWGTHTSECVSVVCVYPPPIGHAPMDGPRPANRQQAARVNIMGFFFFSFSHRARPDNRRRVMRRRALLPSPV